MQTLELTNFKFGNAPQGSYQIPLNSSKRCCACCFNGWMSFGSVLLANFINCENTITAVWIISIYRKCFSLCVLPQFFLFWSCLSIDCYPFPPAHRPRIHVRTCCGNAGGDRVVLIAVTCSARQSRNMATAIRSILSRRQSHNMKGLDGYSILSNSFASQWLLYSVGKPNHSMAFANV